MGEKDRRPDTRLVHAGRRNEWRGRMVNPPVHRGSTVLFDSVAEMRESARCCGFGGLFSIRMPEVSNAMTAEKLRQAVEAGASVLVTADPGCLMQMRGLAEDVRVEHIATVLEKLT